MNYLVIGSLSLNIIDITDKILLDNKSLNFLKTKLIGNLIV